MRVGETMIVNGQVTAYRESVANPPTNTVRGRVKFLGTVPLVGTRRTVVIRTVCTVRFTHVTGR